MEQVLALHGLLQQRSILQHQSLDLVQQVAILLLKVSLQLAQQLTHTKKNVACLRDNVPQHGRLGKRPQQATWETPNNRSRRVCLPHLALVGELGGGDVQLLVLLLQFGELGLQLGLVQLGAVQLALCVLVVQLEVLIVPQQLPIVAVQPGRESRCRQDAYNCSPGLLEMN